MQARNIFVFFANSKAKIVLAFSLHGRSSLTMASSAIIKIILGFIVIKILAYTLGPREFGQLGQLMSVTGLLASFAGGGVTIGLTRVLAQSDSDKKWYSAVAAACLIYLITSIIISLGLVLFWQDISKDFLDNTKVETLALLIFSYWLAGIYNIGMSIQTAKVRLRRMFFLNVVGQLLGVLVLLVLVRLEGFYGAVCGVILLAGFNGLASLLYSNYRDYVSIIHIDFESILRSIRTFFPYMLVMIVSVSAIPISHYMTRELLAKSIGWHDVGNWQGVQKISDVFIQLFGVVLSGYFFPKLAAANSKKAIKNLLIEIYKFLLPFAFIFCIFIFLLRNYIVDILFSSEFNLINELIVFQLIGDFLRLCSSIIIYLSLAKGWVILVVISEIIQGLGFYIGSVLMVDLYGIFATVYSYCVTSFVLFVFLLFTVIGGINKFSIKNKQ